MPRFFCNNITDDIITITGDDAKHIAKVLRMRLGEAITVCDLTGTDYECVVESISDVITAKIISSSPNITEPNVEITLYQALPKGDKFEFIVQKAVELGVTKIVPVLSKYCVVKMKEQDFEKKRIRYQKIALEAAKQSGRGTIPQVERLCSFQQAVISCEKQLSVLYYEHGGEKTNQLITSDSKQVNLFIGSEGGFSEEEIAFAVQHGIKIGTLGKLILRCETAPITAISLILNATGHM